MYEYDERLADPHRPSLLVEERERSDMVIGAPHHAARGVGMLPCGRDAVENTGYLARYLAKQLGCASIIAGLIPIRTWTRITQRRYEH